MPKSLDDILSGKEEEQEEQKKQESPDEKQEEQKESADFVKVSEEKARLELELEQERQNSEKLRQQRDKFRYRRQHGKLPEDDDELDDEDEEEEDVKKKDERVLKRHGVAKVDEVDRKVKDAEDRVTLRMEAQFRSRELATEVAALVTKYPFVDEKKIQEFWEKAPALSADQAVHALYGGKIAEFERESAQAMALGDPFNLGGDDLSFETDKVKELSLDDDAKQNKKIAQMLVTGK